MLLLNPYEHHSNLSKFVLKTLPLRMSHPKNTYLAQMNLSQQRNTNLSHQTTLERLKLDAKTFRTIKEKMAYPRKQVWKNPK